MNKLFTATFLVASAAFFGQALAQEADVQAMSNFKNTGSSTRADVTAQAVAAVRAGRIEFGEAGAVAAAPVAKSSVVSRAQVQAEAREATRLGVVGYGELAREASASEQAAIVAAGQRANSTVLAKAAR